jgi:hypothetical protein
VFGAAFAAEGGKLKAVRNSFMSLQKALEMLTDVA